MNSVCFAPSQRVLRALSLEEPLLELTLATHFNEARQPVDLLAFWQIDQRVHALVSRARNQRVTAVGPLPEAIAKSDTYLALEGTSVGFVMQFAALCQARDVWGKQALLAAPRSATGLWRALVWAGTGQFVRQFQVLPAVSPVVPFPPQSGPAERPGRISGLR